MVDDINSNLDDFDPEDEVVVFEDEDGNEFEYFVLGQFEFEGNIYAALSEKLPDDAPEDEDPDLAFALVHKDEYQVVLDDELDEKLYQFFLTLFEGEEDCCCGEHGCDKCSDDCETGDCDCDKDCKCGCQDVKAAKAADKKDAKKDAKPADKKADKKDTKATDKKDAKADSKKGKK